MAISDRSNPAAHGRIAILDGYRALAILCVLAFHYTLRWAPPLDPEEHLPEGVVFAPFTALQLGGAGVELFFVISGFVILMTLERCRTLGEFAVRRFARLWPALVAAAVLTTVAMWLIGPPDWQVGSSDFLASILLADPYYLTKLAGESSVKWVDGVYWSLSVEIRFYLLAAVVYLIAGRQFLFAWLVITLFVFSAGELVAGPASVVLDLAVFPHYFAYFSLGMFAYGLYRGGPQWLTIVGASVAAAVVLFNAGLHGMDYFGAPSGGVLVVNVAIVALIVLFLVDSPLVRIFCWRPLVLIGTASYSLYLIHQLIGVAIMRRLIDFGIPYLAVLPATIVALVVASMVLFRRVEVPAKEWILSHSTAVVATVERRLPWLTYRSADQESA